ncbi:MAG: ABC transporter permease [Planctomycetota bacterium]|nr:ABC transporter permease [Planctomycetota bacterium]MDA1249383.1 ABC transporter permease [Planctomycetota bacterium]
MNLLTIAWKSLRQRALASSLTALSISLGIMLMVAVLIINGLVTEAFRQNGTGFGLVVGGRGSGDMNLVLNAVYRIGMPGEPLPWRYYDELRNHPYVESAVPMAMGDLTQEGQFPIVATTPEYFSLGYAPGKKFTLKKGGRLLGKYFSAVIGSRVASQNGWDVGSTFQLSHGGMDDHVHTERYEVVGVLGRTGTANDKTVFVDMEAFFMLAGHEKPPQEAIDRLREFGYEVTPQEEAVIKKAAAEMNHEGEEHGDEPHFHAVPNDLKEVSFILVNTKDIMGLPFLAAQINEGVKAQAVNPVPVMRRLLDNVVGNVRTLLLCLTALIVVVAGVGIFVSIYNSMSDRRKEIAIMRALGAHRGTVFSIILGESLLLCLGGGVLGLLFGHGLVFVAAPFIESEAGLILNPWLFEPAELILFPVLMVMATLVGFLPGMTAYRTDVAESLTD